MNTRFPTVLAASLAILLVGSLPAAVAKPKSKPTCAKKGSKTVVRSRDARVFTATVRDEDGSKATGLVGCLYSKGVKTVLATYGSEDAVVAGAVAHIRLAGRYVAYSTRTTASCKASCPPDVDPNTYFVRVHDLQRRRRVRLLTTGEVSAVALTQRGGVAWLSGNQLLAADGAGRRTLDTGTIAGSSLRAEVSIVSWVRDGVERFTRLR